MRVAEAGEILLAVNVRPRLDAAKKLRRKNRIRERCAASTVVAMLFTLVLLVGGITFSVSSITSYKSVVDDQAGQAACSRRPRRFMPRRWKCGTGPETYPGFRCAQPAAARAIPKRAMASASALGTYSRECGSAITRASRAQSPITLKRAPWNDLHSRMERSHNLPTITWAVDRRV